MTISVRIQDIWQIGNSPECYPILAFWSEHSGCNSNAVTWAWKPPLYSAPQHSFASGGWTIAATGPPPLLPLHWTKLYYWFKYYHSTFPIGSSMNPSFNLRSYLRKSHLHWRLLRGNLSTQHLVYSHYIGVPSHQLDRNFRAINPLQKERSQFRNIQYNALPMTHWTGLFATAVDIYNQGLLVFDSRLL